MSTSAWASAASPVVAIRTPRVNRVRRFPGARVRALETTSGNQTKGHADFSFFRSTLRVRRARGRSLPCVRAVKDPNTNGAVAVTAASNGTPEATTTHEKTCSEGARDETTDDGTGGKDWWSSGIEWTKKWALGDSDSESDPDPDDDDDAVAHDDSRDSTSTANIVESVLDRVPLPPWLRDTVNNVLTKETSRASETSGEGETREASETSGSASWTSSSSASTDTTSPAHPESIKGVSKTAVATVGNWKTNPLENMEAFAEALDEGHLVGDGTVHNRTEAIAASATKEAVEKLEDALLAVEGAARSANSARETLEGFGKSVGESTETSTKNTKLDQELQLALQVARLRADEARVASAALGVAASDVQKAREAMRLGSVSEGALDRESGSETDTQRKLRLRGAFGAAGDRLLAASAASRAAAAAASASLKQVAFFEDEDTRGVDIKTSAVKTSGVNNAQRRKKLQRSFEAVEIAGAVSRVAEWSVNQFAKPTPVEISDAVQPALARVVAQSLEPSSPGDLRHARVACGLAAWIYYLPTAHKSLAKFGLRMVVSSLDNADGTGAAGTEKTNSQYEEPFASKDEEPFASKALASEYFTKTETKASRKQTDEMARKAIDAADAALLELARLHDGKSREDEKGHGASVASAREASKLAQRVSQLMRPQDPDEKRNNITAVSKKQAENVSTITKLPVAFAVAVDDTNGALWISIEGSTSLASWQTNLTFQPVPFEDPKFDVRVHRGSYDCAKVLLAQVEGAVTEHVKRHGESARIHITGHSLGGSIAMVLAMMLLVRNVAPKEAFADVWTFGSPYVLCGGDKLLKKLGLPRTFVKSVAMGKDIVPRSFSCYYPWWVRRALEMAPGSLRGTALRVSQIPPPRLPALQD